MPTPIIQTRQELDLYEIRGNGAWVSPELMMTIEYGEPDVGQRAWSAIDRGEDVDIVVRGWRVPILRRTLPLCEIFFGPLRRRHTPGELLKMGMYGWLTAWLFGLYNHATLKGMTARWRETDSTVVVSFRRSAGGASQ